MKHWFIGGLVTVLLSVLFFFTLGTLVMTLWNWLIPNIFHAESINFWQALGLLVLSKILFSSFNFGFLGNHHRCEQCGGSGLFQQKTSLKAQMKAKLSVMSPEEREKFQNDMKRVCCQEKENTAV